MTENGKMLSYDQFKWLRDVMEAQLTIDSLNSHDQIKVDLRYFLQVSKKSLKISFLLRLKLCVQLIKFDLFFHGLKSQFVSRSSLGDFFIFYLALTYGHMGV